MKKFTFLVFVVLVSMIANAQTWTQQNTNMAGTVVGVDQISVVDSNIVWINGFNGSGTAQKIKVHSRTQNGGTTWEPGTYNGFGATVYPYVLTGVTYDKAFAIAMDTASSVASFWKTTNGGASWSLVPNVLNNGTTTFANAVLFWDSSKGFCMGDPVAGKFDIYYTTDGGDTWTPTLAANVSVPLSGEYGYNGFECATKFEGGYAAFITNKGRVYKTSNYGVNWTVTKTAPFTSASTGKIYLTGPNKMIVAAVETGGTAYVWKQTNDNGATWTNYTPSGNFYTYALAYVPKSNNMLVSTSPFSTAKGVSYSNDGGATWTDFIDPLLQVNGSNIQCLAVGFADINNGWVGNYDQNLSMNSILKYKNNINTTSISNIDKTNNIVSIYPNPGNGVFSLVLNSDNNSAFEISVTDITGKTVFKNQYDSGSSNTLNLDLSFLSKGIYVLKYSDDIRSLTQKIVIK
jgi:hypothetical protein